MKAMETPHYSLRWNNHPNHILHAFDTLLQNESLVDVTLVCEESSVRAHKVVLSACSPYFQRIFSENPCKHPVIVLKDLRGWEVQAIIDFMYKGEISIAQEQIASLIKAAESLQVRGLAHTEQVLAEKEAAAPVASATQVSYSPPPLSSLGVYSSGRMFSSVKEAGPILSPFSPSTGSGFEHPVRLPSIQLNFSENPPPPPSSPQPRRKQARPRRRSGDLCIPQDLSKPAASPPLETAENLSMKKTSRQESPIIQSNILPNLPPAPSQTIPSPHPLFKSEAEEQQHPNPSESTSANEVHSPEREHREREKERERERDKERERERERDRERERIEFCNTLESLSLPPPPPDSSLDSSTFPLLPSVSALSLTPPHVFSLDSPLGFFPGMESCRTPILSDATDHHRSDNHIIMGKRKMGRPKGQHSAPRGGPPRSWTNAELTEALQHVWNKKMTTSQASRIFGIPYNSLLMYVRGKYGKSLKLEQLKKDCLGSPGGPLELLGLGPMVPSPNNNNNNNNATGKSNLQEDSVPSDHDLISVGAGFNPYTAANFYPDFAASFPVPVSMIHLLPQSEKNRELFPPTLPLPIDISSKEDEHKSSGTKSRDNNTSSIEEDNESPSLVSGRDEQALFIEQNGQN